MSDIKFSAKIYGETNLGLVRQNNEDTLICQYIRDNNRILCAAIDGLGGYEGGEVASEIARNVIIKHLEDFMSPKIGQLLKDAFVEANNDIVRQQKARPKLTHMGCVASAAVIDLLQGIIYIAHVGDSRIYMYAGGELKKLTHDHSLVGYREEIGEMTEEAAMSHPKRNVIDRYLGDRPLEMDTDYIEVSVFPIEGKSQFLFCSDGLTDLVNSSRITEILSQQISIDCKAQRLITSANEAGGRDNITVVLADVFPVDNEYKNEKESKDTVYEEGKNKKSCSLKWLSILTFLSGLVIGYGLCLCFIYEPCKVDRDNMIVEKRQLEDELSESKKIISYYDSILSLIQN
ncbi:MAG: protein phosphatase 2C domain-containing protein, partial [Muribaculaceae bacterium]|nr:protein phosphatase 2C domain-containing protein [Muribaculaceae bacterium]